jgi:hypothetical protein
VVARGEPDGIADELAAAKADLHAELALIERKFQEGMEEWEAWERLDAKLREGDPETYARFQWSSPMPLGPEELADVRKRRVKRARDDCTHVLAGIRSRADDALRLIAVGGNPTPDRGQSLPPQPPSRRSRRRRRGKPDTRYPREEIARVLKLRRDRNTLPEQLTPTALARKGFSRVAVRRVLNLDDHGAFQLGPRGGLRVYGNNGEFRAANRTESLRGLERALGLEQLA